MLRILCLVAFVVAALEQALAKDDSGVNAFKEKLYRRSVRSLLNTNKYYTYEDIMDYLDKLSEAYANRVVLKDAGMSYENRTLRTITVTNGDGRKDKNVIFLDGALHAREWLTPAAVLYVVEQLVVHFKQNAELLEDYDWVILPLVNPDGYTYSQSADDEEHRIWRNTRKPSGNGCYGANLNRNFDFHWGQTGFENYPCSEHFPGFEPFSESESRAVRDVLHELIESGRGIMYLSVHTAAQMILYPYGYDGVVPENVDELHEVAQAGADAIFAITGTKYPAQPAHKLGQVGGTSMDYAYHIGFPLSITLELPGKRNGLIFEFHPPTKYIQELVEESWVGIRAMAEKAIEKYPYKIQFKKT